MNLQQTREIYWQQGAAVALAMAGLIHLVVAPAHWAYAPAHGLFLALSGLVEIAWAVAFIRRPTLKLGVTGLIIAVSLVVLWGLSRVLPAPFGRGPEAVDAAGLLCKLTEVIGALALAGVIFRGHRFSLNRSAAWRFLLGIIIVSFALSALGYRLARASEPLLPSLAALDDGDYAYNEGTWAETELVSADTLAERSGIHVTQITVTAMGSGLDVRFKVLESDKATAMMRNHELMPTLVAEDSGTVLEGIEGMGHTLREGLVYYMFYPNPKSIVQPGDAVSVVIGNSRLEHFIVQ